MLAAAIAAGIGTARVVETIKEATVHTYEFGPPTKSTFATALAAAAGAALADGDWRTRALAGLGAAGVAMVTHESVSLLRLLGDRQKVVVMRAAGQR